MKLKHVTLAKVSLTVAVTVVLGGYSSDLCSADTVSHADQKKRLQAVASSDHLIVPGERIGPIRLGMGMDEVMAKLGRPDWTQPSKDMTGRVISGDSWIYADLNLSISFSAGATPSVERLKTFVDSYKSVKLDVMTWSDFRPVTIVFHFDNGIRLGASSFDAKRAFSSYSYEESNNDYDGRWMIYKSLGISFLVTRDLRIVRILVSPSE